MGRKLFLILVDRWAAEGIIARELFGVGAKLVLVVVVACTIATVLLLVWLLMAKGLLLLLWVEVFRVDSDTTAETVDDVVVAGLDLHHQEPHPCFFSEADEEGVI